MIFDPTMDITQEEMDLVLGGISDDGKISKEAEKALKDRIAAAKAHGGYMIGEVKRQYRWHTDAVNGKKIADAIDKLW